MPDAENVSYFDRPATLGDVLGWILGFQLIVMTLFAFRIPSVLINFRPMFDALHGELPLVTQWVLGTPSLVWVAFPLALTGVSLWLLVTSKQGTSKVVMALAAYLIELTMLGFVVIGIFYPILQLQSAVRGS